MIEAYDLTRPITTFSTMNAEEKSPLRQFHGGSRLFYVLMHAKLSNQLH